MKVCGPDPNAQSKGVKMTAVGMVNALKGLVCVFQDFMEMTVASASANRLVSMGSVIARLDNVPAVPDSSPQIARKSSVLVRMSSVTTLNAGVGSQAIRSVTTRLGSVFACQGCLGWITFSPDIVRRENVQASAMRKLRSVHAQGTGNAITGLENVSV